MNRAILGALSLAEAEERVARAALVARAGARHHFARLESGRAETPDAELAIGCNLAERAIGLLALADGRVAGRSAVGLVASGWLFDASTFPLWTVLADLNRHEYDDDWFPERSSRPGEARVYEIVAASVADAARRDEFQERSFTDADGDTDPAVGIGERVGRLGLPAPSWLRMSSGTAESRLSATIDLLRRGADEMRLAMTDRYHWSRLSSALSPMEPELLFLGVASHAFNANAEQPRDLDPDPIVRAVQQAAMAFTPDWIRGVLGLESREDASLDDLVPQSWRALGATEFPDDVAW